MAILRYKTNGKWSKVLGALGVETFNGRAGKVTPLAGDYTAAMVGAARIVTGSYTGTGTYGVDNANSLTFDFEPQVLILECRHNLEGGVFPFNTVLLRGDEYGYLGTVYSADSFTEVSLPLAWDGNTVRWWNMNASLQLNTEGSEYRYVAIG